MLPQGEFRKLLTSETENKEEILRRIFKTDRYKLMRELLDQKRKQWKDVLQGKQKRKRNLFPKYFSITRSRRFAIRDLSTARTCQYASSN